MSLSLSPEQTQKIRDNNKNNKMRLSYISFEVSDDDDE